MIKEGLPTSVLIVLNDLHFLIQLIINYTKQFILLSFLLTSLSILYKSHKDWQSKQHCIKELEYDIFYLKPTLRIVWLHCDSPGLDDLAKPIQSFDHKNWSCLATQVTKIWRSGSKVKQGGYPSKKLITSFVCVKIFGFAQQLSRNIPFLSFQVFQHVKTVNCSLNTKLANSEICLFYLLPTFLS